VAVDATGLPVRVLVTSGTTADCTQAIALIDGLEFEALLADRAYDTNKLIQFVESQEAEVVIPCKKNRIEQREHDEYLYKLRHLVENAMLKLKQWRGIATRYAKNTSSFLAAVHIRCLVLWSNII